MHREEKTEVLVVGAGPVGMLTALRLAERDVRVRIIDREERPAAHSYACALHPHSMDLLARVGLSAPLLKVGRQVKMTAFYDGEQRRAELDFSKLSVNYPFLLVLPQSALEYLLEHQLGRHGVTVEWNHRLSDLKPDGQTVIATVDTLCETAKGYIVPDWDWEVLKQTPIRAAFVVGADGHNSLVRQNLGIPFEAVGKAELFAVFEFESDENSCDEIRVVLDNATTNVLWPITGHKARWSFQLTAADLSGDFPPKDRSSFTIHDPAADEQLKRQVHLLARWRAPWFRGEVRKIEWATDVQFEPSLVLQFGRDRSWLAGDAAHQTGPVGVQSMNAGMTEAVELADVLKRILRDQESLELLEGYDLRCRDEWHRLLGTTGGLRPSNGSKSWATCQYARLRSCIPACGENMVQLAPQLGLEFARS